MHSIIDEKIHLSLVILLQLLVQFFNFGVEFVGRQANVVAHTLAEKDHIISTYYYVSLAVYYANTQLY